jgi:Response regulator containing a CheY-like receiver domain and an HTH DNA-binding domain
MDQVLDSLASDTLAPAIVYREQLNAAVIKLADVERQNDILIVTLVALALLAALAVFLIVKYNRKRMKSQQLANSLLKQQAEALPKFTDTVNKLSSKSLSLSEELFDQFQDAIDEVKNGNKSKMAFIVNDAAFHSKYPYISDYPMLSAQEKLVLILYDEDFKTAEIAVLLGTSDNAVRAIKARIKTKLAQSGNAGRQNKKLKILKES